VLGVRIVTIIILSGVGTYPGYPGTGYLDPMLLQALVMGNLFNPILNYSQQVEGQQQQQQQQAQAQVQLKPRLIDNRISTRHSPISYHRLMVDTHYFSKK